MHVGRKHPGISVLTYHYLICSTQIKEYMKVPSDHKDQIILAISTVHNPPQTFVLQPLSGRVSYAFCYFCLSYLVLPITGFPIYLWDDMTLETTVHRWIC